jgi:hypothetical protein
MTLHFSHIGFTDARTFIALRIRIEKVGLAAPGVEPQARTTGPRADREG